MIKNRKISWLELFYDLIFAVVFSRLTESLLEHQTLTGFINAILTFFWLIWG
ncbi:low temperature requirement protein A [Lactobacillus amylovorus]|uniref:low temperature requirement protein A n=1 Tax=Lactobacillus amylovorus TaxID=1604 RepID=UPI0023303612|nr:low temperature requirement protein A [Lactobacillus amylovorus]MDB6248111.1 low temperature requirement protein A [Lactobacillus amylovorus]MDB6256140.1 low temperature requirement protein A [Lactobacillus amylovorus]MDB6267356.1 low temperature requirement protein A [Lactobacillus amylovorus]MDB6269351.1 low temperature requirement protein A [Lactobacillus amylovorus]